MNNNNQRQNSNLNSIKNTEEQIELDIKGDQHNTWMENFYNSNTKMIDYLKGKFSNHPHVHSLIQWYIMHAIKNNPKVSPDTLADYYTQILFANSDRVDENSLDVFFTNAFKSVSKKHKLDKEYESIISSFERDHSYDLAEYVTTLIYYIIKSEINLEEFYGTSLTETDSEIFFDFSSLSKLKYSQKKEFWFTGKGNRVYQDISKRGLAYANIYFFDSSRNEIKAHVQPKNISILAEGISKLRLKNYSIAIHGKILKDKYQKPYLNADGLMIKDNNSIYKYHKY